MSVIATILKTVVFLVVWLLCCLVMALFAYETDYWTLKQPWLYLIMAIPLWLVIFRYTSSEKLRYGHTGAVNLDEIANLMVLREPKENEAIRVAIVRQSGNEQRALGVLTVEDGLHEVHKFFNRKNDDQVRIWRNDSKYFDARITYYHGRGTKEGKVVRGITLEIVS